MSDLVQDLNGYVTVIEFDSGGGYDWHITKIYTRDGRVFARSESGCSCNYWGDNGIYEADLVELPTLDAAGRFYTEEYRYSSGPTWFDVVHQFRDLGLR